jgi:hypothetical protein
LLRYANSALLYRSEGVHTVHQALQMVGENNLRQWAALASLPVLARNKPDELVTLALVRAHFSEYLARTAEIPEYSCAFLMGLFSVLDALIDLPLNEALRRANVAPAIEAALLETAPPGNVLQTIHRLVRTYEAGDWAAAGGLARRLGISEIATVGEAYAESVRWAQEALQGTARRTYSRRWVRQPGTGILMLTWADRAGRHMTLNARLVNVSEGGLGLFADMPIPLDSPVRFDATGLGISGNGSVRYCHSSNGTNFVGIASV